MILNKLEENDTYVRYENISYFGYELNKTDFINKKDIHLRKRYLTLLDKSVYVNEIYSRFLMRYYINDFIQNKTNEIIHISVGAIIIAIYELGYKIQYKNENCYFNFTQHSFRKLITSDFQKMYY